MIDRVRTPSDIGMSEVWIPSPRNRRAEAAERDCEVGDPSGTDDEVLAPHFSAGRRGVVESGEREVDE